VGHRRVALGGFKAIHDTKDRGRADLGHLSLRVGRQQSREWRYQFRGGHLLLSSMVPRLFDQERWRETGEGPSPARRALLCCTGSRFGICERQDPVSEFSTEKHRPFVAVSAGFVVV
jgi:hypothetical protein